MSSDSSKAPSPKSPDTPNTNLPPTTNNLVDIISRFFAVLASLSLKYRWWVFLVCCVVLALSLVQASKVRMDNGFEAFFDSSDSTYAAYNQYRDDFGSDEIIYLLYKAPKNSPHGVLDKALVEKVHNLSALIEDEVPFVKKIRSITNSELTIGDDEDLNIIKLEEEFPLSQKQLTHYGKLMLTKPFFVDSLISKDLRFGAIVIEMSRSSTDSVEQIRLDPDGGDDLDNLYPQVSNTALKTILERSEFADFEFYLSGDVPLNSVYNEVVYSEMETLGGITFLVIGIVLALFFRGNFIGIFGPLAVVFLALMMTIGFIALMGWNIDMMFGMTPTLLTAIGVAHAVHIVSEFHLYLKRYGDKRRALEETLYLVGTPCLLTSITTAVGFLALAISPIKTISHMAVYISLGVLFAFFLSVTLLSFFLSFTKEPRGKPKQIEPLTDMPKKDKNAFSRILEGIGRWVINHSKLVILLSIGIFILSGIGITRLTVDSNFLKDFSKDVEIRQHTEFVDKTMSGTGSLVYLFDSGETDGIKNPEVLKRIEQIQYFADSQTDMVKKSTSIVDIIKDLNQSFHANQPEYYRIPDSQELVAQYLLVYEFSGGEELKNYVSDDYSRATLELRTPLSHASEVEALKHKITDFIQQQPNPIVQQELTGISALWIRLVQYISDSQIKGLGLALVVITILMCLIFRSIQVGLISMVPNVTPVVITLGIMGWANVPLDYSKLLIATVAIGIAVDDTIHMMVRFHHEFKRLGDYKEAFLNTINDVGRALVITSVTLILGFLVFTLSIMDNQFWFGVLLASTIFIALIADFLLMPALILLFKPFGKEFKVIDSTAIKKEILYHFLSQAILVSIYTK